MVNILKKNYSSYNQQKLSLISKKKYKINKMYISINNKIQKVL